MSTLAPSAAAPVTDLDLTPEGLSARSYLYTVFAILLGNPMGREAWALLHDAQTHEALALLVNARELDAAYRTLADAEPFEERGRDLLEGEFNRAFVGPNRLVAPPWESVYVSGDRTLFRACTLDVRRAYATSGFSVVNKGAEADDHIATECEFLGALYGNAYEALVGGDVPAATQIAATARAFEQEHLAAWAPSFAGALAAGEGCTHYAALARLLAAVATRS